VEARKEPFRLFAGGRLTGNPARSAALAILVCWSPYALTAPKGTFVTDPADYVRFLFALPLLLFWERIVDRRVGLTFEHLRTTDLVAGPGPSAVEGLVTRAAAASTRRWFDAAAAVLVLALLGWTLRTRLGEPEPLPFHELWALFVGRPLFQLEILRWLIRAGIWAGVLRRLSRCELRIPISHPDRRGGLAFLNAAQAGFVGFPLALASVLVAALWENAVLAEVLKALGALLAVIVALFLGPLLPFTPRLLRAKIPGAMEFTRYSSRNAETFEQRMGGKQEILSQDICAARDLLDLDAHARRMSVLLPDRRTLLTFVLACGLPAIPVAIPELPPGFLLQLAKQILL
jgi:hypothetical protein